MKAMVSVAVAALVLAGCSINKGISDQLPKLSSNSGKSVDAYVQCLQPKWKALTSATSVVQKKGDARLDARDKKAKIQERLVVSSDAGSSQVVLYEVQKNVYDEHYREAAISCL